MRSNSEKILWTHVPDVPIANKYVPSTLCGLRDRMILQHALHKENQNYFLTESVPFSNNFFDRIKNGLKVAVNIENQLSDITSVNFCAVAFEVSSIRSCHHCLQTYGLSVYTRTRIRNSSQTSITFSPINLKSMSMLQLSCSGISKCNMLYRYENNVCEELKSYKLKSDKYKYAVELSVLNNPEISKAIIGEAINIEAVHWRSNLATCHSWLMKYGDHVPFLIRPLHAIILVAFADRELFEESSKEQRCKKIISFHMISYIHHTKNKLLHFT